MYTQRIVTTMAKPTGNPRRLRQIRTELHLTQKEMAEAVAVRSNTWARWERGDLTPPLVAEQAAEYIRVTTKTNKGESDDKTK